MKTIKIIDLLNKIANEEEVPLKVKYDNYIWVLRKQFNDYWNDEQYLFIGGFDMFEDAMCFLNDEVEIIEEEKEIEKLNLDTDELLKNVVITAQDYVIEGKINELIDAVNELKRGN